MLTVVQAHFEDNAFENCREDGKRPLKWNAVPTLFSIPNKPKRRAADTILVSAPFEKRVYIYSKSRIKYVKYVKCLLSLLLHLKVNIWQFFNFGLGP